MMLLLVPCPVQDYQPDDLRRPGISWMFERPHPSSDGFGWHFVGTWGLEILQDANNRQGPRPEGRGQWATSA